MATGTITEKRYFTLNNFFFTCKSKVKFVILNGLKQSTINQFKHLNNERIEDVYQRQVR